MINFTQRHYFPTFRCIVVCQKNSIYINVNNLFVNKQKQGTYSVTKNDRRDDQSCSSAVLFVCFFLYYNVIVENLQPSSSIGLRNAAFYYLVRSIDKYPTVTLSLSLSYPYPSILRPTTHVFGCVTI